MDSRKDRQLSVGGCAIAVMAKRPEPGRVKTRLCPPLTPQQAADLYEAFLLDTVSLASGIGHGDVFVAFDPDTARDYFSRMTPAPVKCIPQGPGNLGARLSRISSEVFSRGYRKLVILASDAPHLPPRLIRRAFSLLDNAGVVLGPCDDGGYYLIGSRSLAPGLFAGIPWSTSWVLDHTIRRARETGMTYALLPTCYDIDTWEDAERLRQDMQRSAPMDMNRCPRTQEALRDYPAFFTGSGSGREI